MRFPTMKDKEATSPRTTFSLLRPPAEGARKREASVVRPPFENILAPGDTCQHER